MRTCTRCAGNGAFVRVKGRVFSFKTCFATCTDCGGWGSKPAPKMPKGRFTIEKPIAVELRV